MPPAIKRMILELGLKYRPINQEAARAHSDAVDLLAEDLADIPPHLLERAIAQWVRSSRFMPKASDLIGSAKAFVDGESGGNRDGYENAQLLANRYNARLASEGKNMRWAVGHGNELRLEPGNPHQPFAKPLTRDELDHMPEHLASLGLKYGFLERHNGQLIEINQ